MSLMINPRFAAIRRNVLDFKSRPIHMSATHFKVQAGRYKVKALLDISNILHIYAVQVTLDHSKPLTYEMAVKPENIGIHKSFNSFNTGQLEDTYGVEKEMERGGASLSHKMFIEDMFIRKFLKGTWSEMFLSEIIIKRQHNTIRVSALVKPTVVVRKLYFLIGYSEEMLGQWLKCPVKLELEIVNNPKSLVYKYV